MMKKRAMRSLCRQSLLTLAVLAVFGLATGPDRKTSQTAADVPASVLVIPVSGTVDQAMAAFIGRALAENAAAKNQAVVLELDTYGGEVDAAFRIVDTMLKLTDRPTIAFVKTKAISAGALIALSCKKLYMQNHTTLGDVAPLIMKQDGPEMLGEKFQAPIRAKFRILSKQNGYPKQLTEAMVTNKNSVFQVRFPDTTLYLDTMELAELPAEKKSRIVATKRVVKSGELLTMDDVEAHELDFSQKSVADFDDLLKQLGYQNAQVIRYRENWSEKFVKYLSMIAPLLMTIGIGLLYIEFKSPGFGAPGIVGICLLALVFFGQYMVGLANYTEILLAALGVIIIGIDIFIFPTGGLLAMGGGVLLVIALVLSLQGFTIPKPEFPWQQGILLKNLVKVLISFVAAGGVSFLFIRFGLPRLGRVVRGPYLTEALTDTTAASGLVINVHPGDKGTVVTALRPAGRATINGEEFDVVSNGEFIEKGAHITVAQVLGTRIVVNPEKAL